MLLPSKETPPGKLCLHVIIVTLALVLPANGQGTFIYDQQSSTDETPFPGSGPVIQQLAIYGQSFTPSLSGVDFIRLKLSDNNSANGLGATIYINFRTGSITGPILGSSIPIALTNGFAGVVDFNFVGTIPLTPETVYYFEPLVQSGDLWRIDAGEYNYARGMVFAFGAPADASDVWFREGQHVPEPSSLCVLLLGGALVIGRWKQRLKSPVRSPA